MDVGLDTFAAAFHVAADDLLKALPERVPYRPRVGISPKISAAEVMTLALMQALLGFISKARCAAREGTLPGHVPLFAGPIRVHLAPGSARGVHEKSSSPPLGSAMTSAVMMCGWLIPPRSVGL